MSAMLTFSFPWNTDATLAIRTVADHFGVTVAINGGAPEVPTHLKAAVEGTAKYIDPADNPANGVEMNPAIAFGGLLNGAAGNGQPANPPSAPLAATAESLGNAQTAATHITTTPGNTSPVEFDSTGLPWDARIHSGNKTKTPKGEWRAMKGCDKNLIKAVEMELRAKHPAGNVTSQPVASATAAVAQQSTVVVADVNAKKAAALAFAHTEALRVAGPQLIDDTVLNGLLNGTLKSITMSPEAHEWYGVYYAKRNAAYKEFMERPDATAPAVPAAPTPPAVPDAPTSPTVDLDATGLPWDARIHNVTKLKDDAGVWMQRFDVPGEVKLQVMAELRVALAGNDAGQQSSAPAGAVGGTPIAPTPAAAPVIVTADEAKADFTKLMQWIVGNQLAGRIAATAGPDVAKQLGFADAQGNGQLVLMREHAGAFAYVVQLLQAQGAR